MVVYDNLGRVTCTERHDGSATGTLLAQSQTFYDGRGRAYQTKQYAVDASRGIPGGIPGNSGIPGRNSGEFRGHSTKYHGSGRRLRVNGTKLFPSWP